MVWSLRTGAQWRGLPEQYGNWNSVYKRSARWEERDIWAEMHAEFVQDPDMESVLLDSTVARAHNMFATGGSNIIAVSLCSICMHCSMIYTLCLLRELRRNA